MPVIKVWCLPASQSENELRLLHKAIVAAVVAIPELELHGEQNMTCLFPPDRMQYGLGEEIVVEVTGLFETSKRTHMVRWLMAEAIGLKIRSLYPDSKVEVFVYPFNQDISAFWGMD